MRIVVKWCKELENTYKNISNRQWPFRFKDGEENFLSPTALKTMAADVER